MRQRTFEVTYEQYVRIHTMRKIRPLHVAMKKSNGKWLIYLMLVGGRAERYVRNILFGGL